MKRIFTLFAVFQILALCSLTLILSHSTYAQDFRYIKNVKIDSLDKITGMACDDFNNSYAAFMTEGVRGQFGRNGKVQVTKFDSLGTLIWNLKFNGDLMVSDMILEDTNIYVTGQSTSAIEAGGIQLGSGKMFAMGIGKSGGVLWMEEVDSLNGENAKLAFSNDRLFVSGYLGFPSSRIVQLDLSGNEVERHYFPDAFIGDMVFDKDENLFVTGVLLPLKSKFDTLNVVAPYGYGNFLVKFNDQIDGLWVRFTQYITLDHHQRVEAIGDRIAVLHKVRAQPFNKAMVRFYNSDGSFYDSMEIKKTYMPHFEMGVVGDELILMYEKRAVPDTVRYLHLDENMTITEKQDVIGDIPALFNSEIFPFEIATNKCNIFSIINYQSDTLQIDSAETLQEHFSTSNNAILRFNTGCSLNNTSSISGPELGELVSVYPNPFSSHLTIEMSDEISRNEMEFSLINLYGQKVEVSYSINEGNIHLERGSLASGVYLFRVSTDNIVLSTGKIIAE
jgi:hypothetical protein